MPALATVAIDQNSFYRPDRKLRILYAEDQATSRIVTTALLTRMGYTVDAVEDGELALAEAKARAYDLILLDIEMPVMDGVTAARRIRAEAHHCNAAPIIALSAFLADSTEVTNWRQDFDHALPKPANAKDLQMAVDQALARGVQVSIAAPAISTDSFRAVLPKSMWKRLAAQAAEEMRMLALSVAACQDAGDAEQEKLTVRALRSLAASFDAEKVLDATSGESGPRKLVQSISDWLDGV